MRAVRPVEVVEALPFVQFGFEIDIAFVAKQLIEFLPVRAVRPFYLAVELGRASFDVSMADTEIFDVPMERRLELMAIVGPDFPDAERKLFNNMVDEVDCIGLYVSFVNL